MQIGFCAVDVVFISREIAANVRIRVHEQTGIPKQNLMISASHTHSGPVTFSDIFYDPVVPKADPEYISYLTNKLVDVYVKAFQNKRHQKLLLLLQMVPVWEETAGVKQTSLILKFL